MAQGADSVAAMRYAMHEQMVAPARPKAGLIRLMLAIVVFVICYVALTVFYFGVAAGLVTPQDAFQFTREVEAGASPRGMIVVLLSFLCGIAALWITLRLVQARAFATLFGPGWQALRDFLRVLLALAPIYAILAVLPLPEGLVLTPNLAPAVWLSFLPFGLLAVLVQISAEELVFRGWLQSQLAARFRHPLAWMVLPSLAFGVLHYDPSVAGGNAVVIVIWATVFGLAAADLTARSGSLGAALALHFAGNVSAILVASMQGDLDGLALFNFPFSADDTEAAKLWMPLDMGLMLCSWLAARLALKR